MIRRYAARPETARLRPRTRLTTQAARPVCRPARSAFFGRRIRIANAHHTVLALAHRDAGFAPGAALLPAQPGRVQGAPDRIGADPGQPVWSLAQGFLQQAHGPGSRAVLFAVRGSRHFGQNALLLAEAIAEAWPSAVTRLHGREPVAVEAADPGGDRLIVPSSDLVSCRRVAGPLSNGQERSSALDLRGGSTERAAQAGQGDPFVRSEWAEGLCGGATWDTSEHEDHPITIPELAADDPLAMIRRALHETRGNRAEAARRLGVQRQLLY